MTDNEPDQWPVQIQALIQLKANVYVYRDHLNDEDNRRAWFTSCHNIEALVAQLGEQIEPSLRLCVIPAGPQAIAYLRQSEAVSA